LPGFIALVVTLVGLLVFGIRAAADATAARGPASSALLDLAMHPAVPWIALALVLTIAPLVWAMRVMRPRSG
jgi:hypothetical protein